MTASDMVISPNAFDGGEGCIGIPRECQISRMLCYVRGVNGVNAGVKDRCYVTSETGKIYLSSISNRPGQARPARRYPLPSFSEPWRVPFMNSRLTMLRNGILMIDNVTLRDIKCNVALEHVNELLGFGCYNESSKKGIEHAHI